VAVDKLRVLLRLRERTLDQAREALAECVAAETAAMDAIRAVDTAIQRERMAADQSGEAGQGREMFAAWSARARAIRAAAVRTLMEAEGQTAEARGVLTAARSAVRVVERLSEERAVTEQAAADAIERHTLDDVAREQHRIRSKM
jgi:hypothetical protein